VSRLLSGANASKGAYLALRWGMSDRVSEALDMKLKQSPGNELREQVAPEAADTGWFAVATPMSLA